MKQFITQHFTRNTTNTTTDRSQLQEKKQIQHQLDTKKALMQSAFPKRNKKNETLITFNDAVKRTTHYSFNQTLHMQPHNTPQTFECCANSLTEKKKTKQKSHRL